MTSQKVLQQLYQIISQTVSHPNTLDIISEWVSITQLRKQIILDNQILINKIPLIVKQQLQVQKVYTHIIKEDTNLNNSIFRKKLDGVKYTLQLHH